VRAGRTSNNAGESGFTLIEVMISILLTVIAVIGIMALYMTETKASTFSRHSTEATTLAQDGLEQVRSKAVVTGTSSVAGLDALGRSGGIFERAVVIAPSGTDYYDVTVYVGWDEDEAAGASCTAHSACSSKFCLPSTSKCANRAVIVSGRRNQ